MVEHDGPFEINNHDPARFGAPKQVPFSSISVDDSLRVQCSQGVKGLVNLLTPQQCWCQGCLHPRKERPCRRVSPRCRNSRPGRYSRRSMAPRKTGDTDALKTVESVIDGGFVRAIRNKRRNGGLAYEGVAVGQQCDPEYGPSRTLRPQRRDLLVQCARELVSEESKPLCVVDSVVIGFIVATPSAMEGHVGAVLVKRMASYQAPTLDPLKLRRGLAICFTRYSFDGGETPGQRLIRSRTVSAQTTPL